MKIPTINTKTQKKITTSQLLKISHE